MNRKEGEVGGYARKRHRERERETERLRLKFCHSALTNPVFVSYVT